MILRNFILGSIVLFQIQMDQRLWTIYAKINVLGNSIIKYSKNIFNVNVRKINTK